MISADSVIFKRGDAVIFDGLSFAVHAGQRFGIVGRNGVGKSTLFELLRGRLDPDDGDITKPSDWTVSHMRQEVEATDRPALEFVIDGHEQLRRVEARIQTLEDDASAGEGLALAHAEYDDLGGHQAKTKAASILAGLGFKATEFAQPFSSFSGGWRIRLSLAQTLMRPCDLLLLDEPTNHLDLEATVWLEHYLIRREGTLLVIAHDRRFLDNVSTNTLHLIQGQGQIYRGGYSQFVRARTEALERQQKEAAKRAQEIAHIEKFVQRFRAKASKAKQVQSRVKVLERLKDSAPMLIDSPYKVRFSDPEKASNPLVDFRQLTLGYDDTPVLENMSQAIYPGARIGVLGVNGAGKSTLLKCLVGELTPLSGELTRGQHALCGYFSQHQMETLDADETALHHIIKASDYSQQSARDFLGGWGFDGDMVTRPVRTLSGGEKARLVLALIALKRPALLVLDEPTNHLDIDMRQALAMALQTYAGALVLVSHDRELLDACCDELWLAKEGRLHRFSESVDAYANLQHNTPVEAVAQTATANKRQERILRAEARKKQSDARKKLKQLESRVTQLTERLAAEEAQLADPESYRSLPADELDALLARAARTRQKLEAAEHEWLTVAEALENA